ncbi:hypothetical protein ET475_00615 [Microbacterium protaetiae]|uniref:Uncharacterized protein n=2 Tax=Microbacterium protaetiae TaxID=2509458 RepID=A0A4P6EBH8_9MICO|nr:hypothetical protein ET475_00615 [Microbacterium protaetiae]
MTVPADSLAVLGAGRAPAEWMPFASTQTVLGGTPVTVVHAVHQPWELRIVRVDTEGVAPGVRLTGPAVAGELWVTELHQGVDLCAGRGTAAEAHSEVRMLVPWDGDVTLADAADEAMMPQVTVHDLPGGYPVIIAVRTGAEPPPVPQVDEGQIGEDGKPIRLRRTGSLIPEIEIAPDGDGGHAISVRWPDKVREIVDVPAR